MNTGINPAMWFGLTCLTVFCVGDYLFYVGVFPGGSATHGITTLARRWPLTWHAGLVVGVWGLWKHIGVRLW